MGKAWLRRPPETDAPDLLVLHLLRRRSRRHLPAYEGNASCTPKTPWFLDAPFRKTSKEQQRWGDIKPTIMGVLTTKTIVAI